MVGEGLMAYQPGSGGREDWRFGLKSVWKEYTAKFVSFNTCF